MDYRVNLAARMLANKRGSLIGAVLAVSIGILVIHVNFVIFQGIYDAIIRDMTEYRFGDIFVSHEEEATIERSHVVYTIGLKEYRWLSPRRRGVRAVQI